MRDRSAGRGSASWCEGRRDTKGCCAQMWGATSTSASASASKRRGRWMERASATASSAAKRDTVGRYIAAAAASLLTAEVCTVRSFCTRAPSPDGLLNSPRPVSGLARREIIRHLTCYQTGAAVAVSMNAIDAMRHFPGKSPDQIQIGANVVNVNDDKTTHARHEMAGGPQPAKPLPDLPALLRRVTPQLFISDKRRSTSQPQNDGLSRSSWLISVTPCQLQSLSKRRAHPGH